MRNLRVALLLSAALALIGCRTGDDDRGMGGPAYDRTHGTGVETNDYDFSRPNPTPNPWPGAPTQPY